MEKDKLLKMNLQYFAEPNEPTDPVDPVDPDDGGKKEDGNGKTFTRDEIAKMMAAEHSKWEKEHEDAIEQAKQDGKSEGEKLAKMSAKEREDEALKARMKDLDDREQALSQKELKAQTLTELSNNGLPSNFLNMVLGEDADSTNANIKALKVTYDKEVAAKVVENRKTDLPKTGVNVGDTDNITSKIQQRLANANE